MYPNDDVSLVDHELCVNNWQSAIAVTCAYTINDDFLEGSDVFSSRVSGEKCQFPPVANFRWYFYIDDNKLHITIGEDHVCFMKVGKPQTGGIGEVARDI